MEFLGIGPSELVFIILIAIIILGPKDMQKAGKTIGRFLNQLVRSDSWKVLQKTSTEIRNLPRNLMREANMEEVSKELQDTGTQIRDMDRDIRQTIDARPHPPLSTSGPDPAPPPTPSAHPVDEGQPAPPPPPPSADEAQAASQPPTTDPNDVNGEMKQNG